MVRFRTLKAVLALLCAVGLLAVGRGVGAQSGVPSSATVARVLDAGAADSATDASPTEIEDSQARALRRQAENVRRLVAGKLDVAVDAPSLFDVPLDDDRAVAIEARRLRAIVDRVASGNAEADAGAPVSRVQRSDAGATATADAALDADATDEPSYADLPPAVWEARMELDRARLVVYRLPRTQRLDLLSAHAKHQKEHADKIASSGVTKAEEAAQRAAEAQRTALAQARRARSEAARLVQEERARLLGVKMRLAEADAALLREARRTDIQREQALQLRRRVRELIDHADSGGKDPAAADRLFADLRATLRQRRSALGAALDALGKPSTIPPLGDNPLTAIDIEVDTQQVTTLRAELEAQIRQLVARESAQRWELAALLMQQVESLDADRLSLYDQISPARRSSLTGFDTQGWDQAWAEGHQVQLIGRYHVHAGRRWVLAVLAGGEPRTAAFFLGINLLQLLALVGFAAWGLRRLGPLLRWWRDGLPVSVLSSGPSVTTRLHLWLGVIDRIRVPLGWLIVGWVGLWMLGSEYRQLLEVRLLWTIIAWNLGAILVVDLIDAIVGRRDSDDEVSETGRLRLSTLRLIGRTVVLIGLTLSLSTQLVGRGTIYAWVLATCWLLLAPLVFVIVLWWRPVVFARLRTVGSTDRIAGWVVARERRWSSLLAAAVGGGYLLSQSGARLAKTYLSELVVTRRILAYLFRRELAKQSLRQDDTQKLEPLTEGQLLAFDPEARPPELLPTAADQDVARVLGAIDAPGGGVFAVVGERGSGKTTLLERIASDRSLALTLHCPLGGLEPLLTTLRANHGVASKQDAPLIAAVIARREGGAVLVDDTQRLVTPTIGGLDDLDRLLAIARSSSERCTWVLAFDRALWQFVQRSRGARPLFDDVIRLQPWSEEQIASLVQQRSQHANVEPTFEDLVANPSSDDFMRTEQLNRTAAGFYRLLWDYSAGNPAVALQFWRHSLQQDEAGTVHVRLFAAPEMDDLEELPDTTAFVLHAIIQLEPVREEELTAHTRIAASDVLNAVRYSLSRGYLERVDDRLRVSWQWYRAVTSLLQRRHLQED